eukprot:9121999-Alexandrium_andersonii.AAC.1
MGRPEGKVRPTGARSPRAEGSERGDRAQEPQFAPTSPKARRSHSHGLGHRATQPRQASQHDAAAP